MGFYDFFNYVYLHLVGAGMCMCVSAHGCQKVVSGPWSWPYRKIKASQQDAENIILVLWKSSKCSSTLSHLSSQTNLLGQKFQPL